ncbi:helix-turn-helix domain-containing protein [Spirosoma sp. HMF3257]|uniref:AraC family transcriptional regulator n=1 Tax=Spirosoma telluris TaxID=2183553 RepID=A0A327NQE1_9BACT|nr:helix-turn-helix domain-containing protein [Spirosoma telluris]RAI77427.1 AraC family transcriptional regulator [Spirosoma telluris]
MFIRFYPPTPALRGFVQRYMVHHVQTDKSAPLLKFPFPPAAEQVLFFYPRDSLGRIHHRTGQVNQQPDSIIVGPQVSRVDITMGHNHLIVGVFFEPGALHRLLGIPMNELFDESLDSFLVWANDIRLVDEQLRETDNYDQMQHIVEAFLLRRLRQKQVEKHPIDTVFQYMLNPTRPVSLDYLANQACLSPRQFERKCHERLGFGPKTFSRVVRFSKAFRLKERQPELDWLDVALTCGYYDFRHMLRDFKEFAGSTPTLLLQQETSTLIRPYTRLTL